VRGTDGHGYANAVARFDLERHPQFRIGDRESGKRLPLDQVKDPGRLIFNHFRHLAEGMKLDPNGKEFRYKDIKDAKLAEYYARQASAGIDEPVHLTCASCHQLDAEDFAPPRQQIAALPEAAVLPPRAAGALMLPIVYEKHCKGCHPLTFDRDPTPQPDSRHVSVPHRLQPDAIHEFLERHYTGQLLKGNPSLFDTKVPARLVPGKAPDKALETARQRIAQQVEAAEKVLYEDKKTCGECHHYEGVKDKVVPKRIIPPNVPTVWLPHAKFNHSSHRAVDCQSCHPRADASTRAEDIMLPGIEVCVQCHALAKSGSGGARQDCTECHRYHNGDLPSQGVGAAPRNPREPRSIESLVSGP
jgi:hypothetical protein